MDDFRSIAKSLTRRLPCENGRKRNPNLLSGHDKKPKRARTLPERHHVIHCKRFSVSGAGGYAYKSPVVGFRIKKTKFKAVSLLPPELEVPTPAQAVLQIRKKNFRTFLESNSTSVQTENQTFELWESSVRRETTEMQVILAYQFLISGFVTFLR
ncbi:hypothetical protein YC2023_098777 [Brassica napus]